MTLGPGHGDAVVHILWMNGGPGCDGDSVAPDVEAFYVTRAGPGPESYLVPIDDCYGLIGAVRLRRCGLDGGQEIRDTLAGLLADLSRRTRPVGSED